MREGTLFIVSAPSGTGKTTILKRLMATTPRITFSVSHTTRKPRQGEMEGIDYHYVTLDVFQEMIEADRFLEWAKVHDNYYGTSRDAVDLNLALGMDVVLDIDIQGARQLRERAFKRPPIFIFVVPPSWEELEHRLTGRGTDGPETVALRLKNARDEVQNLIQYDYVIENKELEQATEILKAIVIAERARRRRSASGQPLGFVSSLKKASEKRGR